MRPGMVRGAALAALLVSSIGLAATASAAAFERLGQYGTGLPGGGVGQMEFVLGVAAAPDGTVVVSDNGSKRIAFFSQAGKFLRATGKNVSTQGGTGPEVCTTDCQPGELGLGAGELNGAWGLAAAADEVYVAEQASDRVSAFDYQGRFLRAFGADVGGVGVNVCTAVCLPGTGGGAAGQMSGPSGVALDETGRLHVSEAGTNRVDVFDPRSGQFLFAFGKDVGGAGVHTCTAVCAPGTGDGSPGSIVTPFSIAVSGSQVFVGELSGQRISVFDTAGAFLRIIGEGGEGAGQIDAPYGVGADSGGNAYVADIALHRLSVFGADGSFRAYGRNVLPGAPEGPQLCTTVCQTGSGGFAAGEFTSPGAVAVDCRDSVYVAMVGRIDKWGEPGAGSPPCPPPAAPAKPSNDFRFGKLRRNKKKGIVTVEVVVPGPGSLQARAGRKLKAVSPQPAAARTLRVRIRAIRRGLRVLNRRGRLRATLRVTFTPAGGDANTKSRKLAVLKAVKKKKKRGGKRAARGRPARR